MKLVLRESSSLRNISNQIRYFNQSISLHKIAWGRLPVHSCLSPGYIAYHWQVKIEKTGRRNIYSSSAADKHSNKSFSSEVENSSLPHEERQIENKMIIPKNCPGCGAEFQNSSKLKAGYLPPINLEDRQIDSFLTDDELARIADIEKSNEPISPKDVKLLLKKRNLSKKNTFIVCWKCHSSGHQNLLQNMQLRPSLQKTNRAQFSDLKINPGGLLVLMLDMMDLPNSIIEDLTDYTGQKDLIVLLNKADIMPPSINWSRVNAFLKRYPIIKDAKAIIPISTNTGQSMDLVAKYLSKYFQKGNDIYLVGCTNAGKSSFMNYWKKKIGHEFMVTTSITSGTTAGLLKLTANELLPALSDLSEKGNYQISQLPSSCSLIDTAGIVKEGQLYNFLNAKQLKYLAPTKKLVEHTLELRPNKSYWIGGLIRLDIHSFQQSSSSSSPTIRFYLVPKLKVFPSRLGKKPDVPKEHATNLRKLPPILSSASISTEDQINLQFAARLDQKSKKEMIWISGVGWITFFHDSPRFTAEVYSHLGKGISVSKTLHFDS